MINNPIMSVVYLVSVYILSSLLFIILGYDFVGIIYIIVYVGAIAILLLFVIMMMNLLPSTPSQSVRTTRSPNILRSTASYSGAWRQDTYNTPLGHLNGSTGGGKTDLTTSESTIYYTNIGARHIGWRRPSLAVLSMVVAAGFYHYVEQLNHSTITDTTLNITPATWLGQITTLDHTTWLLSIITSWASLTITILSPLLFTLGFLLYSDGAILLLLLSILLLMVMISIIGLITPTTPPTKSPTNLTV